MEKVLPLSSPLEKMFYMKTIYFIVPGKRGRPRKIQPSSPKHEKGESEDDDEEDDSDMDVAEANEDDVIERPRLRKRRHVQRAKDPRKMDAARRHKQSVRKITQILQKPDRTAAEKKFLASQTAKAVNEAKKRHNLKQTIDDR